MSAGPGPAELAAPFDAAAPMTVGLEEELMLLDPETGALAERADEALALLDGDPRFKRELPAAQLEIMVAPQPNVAKAIGELAGGRVALAEATEGRLRPAAAGVHPTAPGEGALNRGERYDRIAAAFGRYARRQLVCALQVHVAPGSASRALAVYNALRSYLPELTALAANAPFHEGRDTGLATVRPKIAEQLPRQGVPPAIGSWDELAAALAWGAASGAVPDSGAWWWELRPHPGFGTLELRVCDAQTTTAEAAAVAALACCLIAWLGERFDAGERLPVHPSWRIAENRWWAARDGIEGELADLDTGVRVATRRRLAELIDALGAVAERLGCAAELDAARRLANENGAVRQRRVAAERGIEALPGWLAERWLR